MRLRLCNPSRSTVNLFQVSNKLMGRTDAVLLFVLSTSLFSQQAMKRTDSLLVARAKNVIISTFDPALPHITLASFLKYETHDPAIDWRVSRCSAAPMRASKNGYDGACVQVYSDLPDNRVVEIMVKIGHKMLSAPELVSVAILENGLERRLHLIELPAAIYRGKPKSKLPSPRDLLPLRTVG